MESTGAALKRLVPELIVSKQKFRQAEGSLYRAAQARGGETELGIQFKTVRLVWVTGSEATEERNVVRAPKRQLRFADHRSSELRAAVWSRSIVPIYLATLAVRQQSQTIRFRTAAEMLETFDMHKGGTEYRRLVAAFERIFEATIFFGTDTLSKTAKVVQRSRFRFFHEASTSSLCVIRIRW